MIGAGERVAASSIEVRVADECVVRGVLVVTPWSEVCRSAAVDGDEVETAAALLRALSGRERLQFALHRPEGVMALHEICAATPTGVMLAFRCEGPWLRS